MRHVTRVGGMMTIACAATLAAASGVQGAVLFEDDFNDNNLDGWIFNQPSSDQTEPASRTTVVDGVVQVATGTRFVQMTPGSSGVFTSFATGGTEKVTLSADLAGDAFTGTHSNENTGFYLYASSSATNAQATFYNLIFRGDTGAISIGERSPTNAQPDILASTTVEAGVLNQMNAWRLELTPVGANIELELFLNDTSILTHTDLTPRDMANVTPAIYAANGHDIAADNVVFSTSVVPEPTAMAVLGIAGCLLLRRRGN